MERICRLKVKNLSDTLSTCFLVVAVISTFVFEVQSIELKQILVLNLIAITVVLPHIHAIDVTIQYFHTTVGLFVVFNLMTNLYWLITTDNSTKGLLMPAILKPNWRFCPSCEANAPPRSYHCHICDKCILKRDHHCVFSGKQHFFIRIRIRKSISRLLYWIQELQVWNNFIHICQLPNDWLDSDRYYYGLLIYVAIGGLYATALNQFFIWEALGGLSWVSVANHLLPFPFWLAGRIPFKVMIWTFIAIIDLCGFLFASGLLYYHGMLAIKNQTTYEKNKSITQYDLGHWKTNVVESLGPNWLRAVLLSPLVSSQLPRNGIDFPTFKNKSLNSQKSK